MLQKLAIDFSEQLMNFGSLNQQSGYIVLLMVDLDFPCFFPNNMGCVRVCFLGSI